MVNTVWREFRYAARGLKQGPAFTAMAILTVAAGIAGPSLVFSLANWTLLRPVPGVVEPHRVGTVATATFEETSYRPSRVEYADYFELRRSLKTVELAGRQQTSVIAAAEQQPARTVRTEFVTAAYLRVLGAPMALGRPFVDDEDVPGTPAQVAVISERLWDDLFARDPDVLERVLRVNGHPFSIVGVTSDGFAGSLRTETYDLWLPGATYYPVNRMAARPGGSPAPGYYEFVARLRPDVTWVQAQSELQGVAGWLLARDAARNENFKTASARIDGPIGHTPFFRNTRVTSLRMMLTGTAILLLIACFNVATMMLARHASRSPDIAVRRALGGSMFDLVRVRLVEGAILWLCGGGVALAVVFAVTRLVDGFTLLGERFTGGEVPLDWRIVAFTALLALAAGLASSLVPALATARANPVTALKAGAPTHSMRHRMASAFIGIQLSATLALLLGALLLTTSVRRLAAVDLGFDVDRTHIVGMSGLRGAGYRGDRATAYLRDFLTRVSASPDVSRITAAEQVPIASANFRTALKPPHDPQMKIPAQVLSVLSGDYFETLRIPLLKGRAFDERDFTLEGRGRVILSERLARQMFGDDEPIGRTIEYWSLDRRGRPFEVIGVARDIQVTSIEGDPELAIYEVADPAAMLNTSIVVRMSTDTDPTALLRAAGASLDPNVPIENVRPLASFIDIRQREWRVLATLMSVVAAIAILLTGVGLAAIVSAGILSRVREFGIRIALGATPQRIGRHAMRQTMLVTGGGLILGSVGAAALAQLLRSRLFGVGPFDAGPWALAGGGLMLVALAASWIPVRRAVRLDVARTLRV